MRRAQAATVVFAVPGHPRIGEKSVPLIEAGARDHGIPVDVLDAVSFLDATAGALQIDPIARGLQVADAEELAAMVDADPFAVRTAWHRSDSAIARRSALQPGTCVRGQDCALAAVPGRASRDCWFKPLEFQVEHTVKEIPLHALDRQDVDHLTSLWVPRMAPLEAVRSPESLTRIVARLRAPGGCPWDREQTPGSLRNAVLEEAYEVVDAIDAGDDGGLAEELGDLLLLVTMQAQIAEENGAFRIEDVFEGINRKLIRRHPHVFGSVSATTPDAVIATWEGVKESERAEKGDSPAKLNPIDRLPRAMPATRKVVEILAPRTSSGAPENPDAGDRTVGGSPSA